ncbi:MAG: hypothetical protein AB7I30_16640 [Isosphaeraceae bacterium]
MRSYQFRPSKRLARLVVKASQAHRSAEEGRRFVVPGSVVAFIGLLVLTVTGWRASNGWAFLWETWGMLGTSAILVGLVLVCAPWYPEVVWNWLRRPMDRIEIRPDLSRELSMESRLVVMQEVVRERIGRAFASLAAEVRADRGEPREESDSYGSESSQLMTRAVTFKDRLTPLVQERLLEALGLGLSPRGPLIDQLHLELRIAARERSVAGVWGELVVRGDEDLELAVQPQRRGDTRRPHATPFQEKNLARIRRFEGWRPDLQSEF